MNLLYYMTASINTTMPFVLIAALGILLKRRKIIDDNFVAKGNKVIFYFAIPVTVFNHIHRADLNEVLDGWFLGFNVVWLIVFFLGTWLFAKLMMKDKNSVSSFVNSAYRSSLSVVAPPLFVLMFAYAEDPNLLPKSILAVSVLLIISYATAAVLFAVHDPKAREKGVLGVLVTIAKNPVVIGVVLGLVFNFANSSLDGALTLPVFAYRTLNSFAGIAMPLAMLCVGANLSFRGVDAKFKYAVIAVVVKLLLMPIVSVLVALAFGFRGSDLTIIMILNALPMAVGAYVMQSELGGDSYIGATTLMMTMTLSALTLTLFIFVFRVLGFLV